jgi:hypothetical protein
VLLVIRIVSEEKPREQLSDEKADESYDCHEDSAPAPDDHVEVRLSRRKKRSFTSPSDKVVSATDAIGPQQSSAQRKAMMSVMAISQPMKAPALITELNLPNIATYRAGFSRK